MFTNQDTLITLYSSHFAVVSSLLVAAVNRVPQWIDCVIRAAQVADARIANAVFSNFHRTIYPRATCCYSSPQSADLPYKISCPKQ